MSSFNSIKKWKYHNHRFNSILKCSFELQLISSKAIQYLWFISVSPLQIRVHQQTKSQHPDNSQSKTRPKSFEYLHPFCKLRFTSTRSPPGRTIPIPGQITTGLVLKATILWICKEIPSLWSGWAPKPEWDFPLAVTKEAEKPLPRSTSGVPSEETIIPVSHRIRLTRSTNLFLLRSLFRTKWSHIYGWTEPLLPKMRARLGRISLPKELPVSQPAFRRWNNNHHQHPSPSSWSFEVAKEGGLYVTHPYLSSC